MKKFALVSLSVAAVILSSCTVITDGPTQPASKNHAQDQPSKQRMVRNIGGFFPFEDNSNEWNYSESGGNTVMILVTDTISDDGVTYFRVSFRENRVDTTDDWFLRSAGGIYFGQSLAGKYELFLPSRVDSSSGNFGSAGSTVYYEYHDSLSVNGVKYYKVMHFQYNNPIIHGFDEITLVDSIGIVELVDHSGRWPIYYAIDSCRVGGTSRTF